jgi:amino acid transporter
LAVAILKSADIAAADQNILSAIATKGLPSPYNSIAVAAFLVSVVGSLDASLIQASRTLLSKARDGYFSPKLAAVSARYGVPTRAILLSVFTTLCLFGFTYFSGNVSDVVNAGVAGSAIFVAYYYGLTGLACARYFWSKRSVSGANYVLYIAWPVTGSIILITAAAMVCMSFGWVTSAIVAGAFIIGLVMAVARMRNTRVALDL